MKIAIIGSRIGFNLEQVRNEVKPFLTKDNSFISGGAKGVDTSIRILCDIHNLELIEILPDNPSIKFDYIKRNWKIVDAADKIFAFWNGESKGTKSVIDYAKKQNKDINIILK